MAQEQATKGRCRACNIAFEFEEGSADARAMRCLRCRKELTPLVANEDRIVRNQFVINGKGDPK